MPRLKFGTIGNWTIKKLRRYFFSKAFWKEDEFGGIYFRPKMSGSGMFSREDGTWHTGSGPIHRGSVSGAVYITTAASNNTGISPGMIINFDRHHEYTTGTINTILSKSGEVSTDLGFSHGQNSSYVRDLTLNRYMIDRTFNPKGLSSGYQAGTWNLPQLEVRGSTINKGAAITLTNKETKKSNLVSGTLGSINFYTYYTGSESGGFYDLKGSVVTTDWYSPAGPDYAFCAPTPPHPGAIPYAPTNIIFSNMLTTHRKDLQESMRIDYHGFVGINRSSPKTKLDVVHDYSYDATNTATFFTSSLPTTDAGGDILKFGEFSDGSIVKGMIVALSAAFGSANRDWYRADGTAGSGISSRRHHRLPWMMRGATMMEWFR